jgi:hypothetical protein
MAALVAVVDTCSCCRPDVIKNIGCKQQQSAAGNAGVISLLHAHHAKLSPGMARLPSPPTAVRRCSRGGGLDYLNRVGAQQLYMPSNSLSSGKATPAVSSMLVHGAATLAVLLLQMFNCLNIQNPCHWWRKPCRVQP